MLGLLVLNLLLHVHYSFFDKLLRLVLNLLRHVDGKLKGFALSPDLDDLVGDGNEDLLDLVASSLAKSKLSLLLFEFLPFHLRQ